MAVRRTPAAPPAAASAAAGAPTPGEHIYIESDERNANPAEAARTLEETVVVRNPIRHTGTELKLFAEGFLKVTRLARGHADAPYYLDLRFIDPVPKVERVIAGRSLATAVGCGSLAALAAFVLRFEAVYGIAALSLAGTSLIGVVALYLGLYSSHEKYEFCTLHGRVTVLTLVASFGSVRKHRALVPRLSNAIERAAERIGPDTAAYLRAEMREHYRLRGGGVLEPADCSLGTGRILAQFDVQL